MIAVTVQYCKWLGSPKEAALLYAQFAVTSSVPSDSASLRARRGDSGVEPGASLRSCRIARSRYSKEPALGRAGGAAARHTERFAAVALHRTPQLLIDRD